MQADLEDSSYPRTEYTPIRFAKAKAFLRFESGNWDSESHERERTEKSTGRRMLVIIALCNTMTL